MASELCPALRLQVLEFLIHSAKQLEVRPVVKFSALSVFADRFYPSLSSRYKEGHDQRNWLLQPLKECNLQLFSLVSIWVASKIHDSRPLSVKVLKALGDDIIKDQHFTTRDFMEAEVMLLRVLNFEIGTSKIAFLFLEELLIQLKEVARVGEILNYEACMDIMDLLYENEDTSTLYGSPLPLAASVVVASYVITVPKLQCEFPVLPWVKFVTSCEVDDILRLVKAILKHIFQ